MSYPKNFPKFKWGGGYYNQQILNGFVSESGGGGSKIVSYKAARVAVARSLEIINCKEKI